MIYFILFYWSFSYLFLLGGTEFKETEKVWYVKVYTCCILYIIAGFLFPMVLGDVLNDTIKHFKINRE